MRLAIITKKLIEISKLFAELAEELAKQRKIEGEPIISDVFRDNTRVLNLLHNLGGLELLYESLDYLVKKYTIEDLYKVRNCGVSSVAFIQKRLGEFNLQLEYIR